MEKKRKASMHALHFLEEELSVVVEMVRDPLVLQAEAEELQTFSISLEGECDTPVTGLSKQADHLWL